MLCIYHSIDFDGKCSAAIVKNKYPDCRLYGIDYGEEFDISKVEPEEEVFLVDFTFDDKEDMLKLKLTCGDLHWIDHHNTIVQMEEELSAKDWLGVRQLSPKVGACELVWDYLYPGETIPYPVYLLSRYDVWQNKDPLWDEEILPFQYGMRLGGWDLDDPKWKTLLKCNKESAFVHNTIEKGNIGLFYEKELSGKMARGLWFPLEWEDLRFQVINRGYANSISAEAIWNPEEFDAVMFFSRGREFWKITMFTDKEIDLSILAKKYGGGGHKQACGFTTKDIMGLLPQLIEF